MNDGIFLMIAGAALATYLTRFPLMVLTGRSQLPEGLNRYLSLIAPSVLTALIVPAVLLRDGRLNLSASNDYLLATGATILMAYFSKNMLASVITGVGMVALLLYI